MTIVPGNVSSYRIKSQADMAFWNRCMDPGPVFWTQKCWTMDQDFGPKTHKIYCYL